VEADAALAVSIGGSGAGGAFSAAVAALEGESVETEDAEEASPRAGGEAASEAAEAPLSEGEPLSEEVSRKTTTSARGAGRGGCFWDNISRVGVVVEAKVACVSASSSSSLEARFIGTGGGCFAGDTKGGEACRRVLFLIGTGEGMARAGFAAVPRVVRLDLLAMVRGSKEGEMAGSWLTDGRNGVVLRALETLLSKETVWSEVEKGWRPGCRCGLARRGGVQIGRKTACCESLVWGEARASQRGR